MLGVRGIHGYEFGIGQNTNHLITSCSSLQAEGWPEVLFTATFWVVTVAATFGVLLVTEGVAVRDLRMSSYPIPEANPLEN